MQRYSSNSVLPTLPAYFYVLFADIGPKTPFSRSTVEHFLLIHIQGCTLWERDAISLVQGFQVNPIVADVQLHADDGPQQFAVLARIERRQRKLVPADDRTPASFLPAGDSPD